MAKAEDADLKSRDSQRKHSDRRRAERHQQWSERRHWTRRRDPDLSDVEQAVREDSAPRAYVAEPVDMPTPRFSLFGDD
jgi:hypothetical protein